MEDCDGILKTVFHGDDLGINSWCPKPGIGQSLLIRRVVARRCWAGWGLCVPLSEHNTRSRAHRSMPAGDSAFLEGRDVSPEEEIRVICFYMIHALTKC